MDSQNQTIVSRVVLLVIFLAPILAIAIVGGYGFAVWMGQLLTASPGA